ncbi:MAG: hypothetical protein ABJE95_32405 [Byssovorax sp.]
MSSDRREGFVRAATKLLRRKGALATAELLALLSAQGLSIIEALSVVNHGFSVRLLVRDPADPSGIAAGPASLPPASRAVSGVVLQTASTRPVDKRKSHRRKIELPVAVEG